MIAVERALSITEETVSAVHLRFGLYWSVSASKRNRGDLFSLAMVFRCSLVCDESLRGELRSLIESFVVSRLNALSEGKETAQLQIYAFICSKHECIGRIKQAGARVPSVTLNIKEKHQTSMK